MGEVFASPIIGLVFEKLSSVIGQEISLVTGVERDFEKLSSTLSTIMAVLADAEEKQVENSAVNNWLYKLKNAASDIYDLLDEYATEALRYSVEGRATHHSGQVCNFFPPCFWINQLAFRYNIGRKMKDNMKRLEHIKEDRTLHLESTASQMENRNRLEQIIENRETISYTDESMIFGREDDKKRIIDLLSSSEYDRVGACVIPIVGSGGIGKTTLAQYAFNDNRVEVLFTPKIWVCVSNRFNIRRILIEIIKTVTMEQYDSWTLDSLQRLLRETIREKKYLLVLDDVWDENREVLVKLRDLLRFSASGSRIIVTSQSIYVAQLMGTIDYPIRLEPLSEEACLSLFRRRAFREGNDDSNPNLIAIGKKIVSKCNGVPLAVNALGNLLYMEKEESEWLSVLDSLSREIKMMDSRKIRMIGAFIPTFMLSFNHLPSYLKRCFAYCSIFPANYRIEKEKLIKLWMAQGLIQPSQGSEQMEDIGGRYFNELLCRSFFQDAEEVVGNEYLKLSLTSSFQDTRKDDRIITSCKMHGLLCDLALYIESESCIDAFQSRTDLNHSCRHFSFASYSMDSAKFAHICKMKKLRTILKLEGKTVLTMVDLNRLFLNCRCLRVLDLSHSGITVLPDSIGNLKLLRYLNISQNNFSTLPESICYIWNLQTLDIRCCSNLSKLPKRMKNLTNLRHLEIDTENKLNRMPAGIGKLTCLLTLPVFYVGNKGGCNIQELRDLNLRGGLEVYNLENVRNGEDAKEASLKIKSFLHYLEFHWSDDAADLNAQDDEGVLEGLEPHSNLRRLYIKNYRGSNFPSWMGDSLMRLVSVELVNCKRCQRLPPFGQLVWLKHLTIQGIDGLNRLNDEFYSRENKMGFSSLESLELFDLPNLEEWLRNHHEGDMRSLRTMEIKGCPRLKVLPHFISLRTLKLSGCDEMAVTLEHYRTPILKTLEIKDCLNLISLPNGLLRNLKSLQRLVISHCPKLTSLPEEGLGNLTALDSLTIWGCDALISLPETVQHLTALHSLYITKSSNFASSAETFKHFVALKSLEITSCSELETLPEELQHLAALRSLSISYCPKLGCLPESLQCLATLQNLTIYDCPLLEVRCTRDGEDWHKISHIPNIKLLHSFHFLQVHVS